MNSEVIGVIFSITQLQYQRVIEGKRIFPKYCNFLKLKAGQRIKFYVEKPIGKIRIEAEIESIEYLRPSNILEKYLDELIFEKAEFSIYISHNIQGEPRTKSRIMVFKIKNIQTVDYSPKSKIYTQGLYIYK